MSLRSAQEIEEHVLLIGCPPFEADDDETMWLEVRLRLSVETLRRHAVAVCAAAAVAFAVGCGYSARMSTDQMTANTVALVLNQDVMIVRADSPDGSAIRWRIGMSRLNRVDNFAPLIPGLVSAGAPDPVLASDSYSFAAGSILTAPTAGYPPLRANPVDAGRNISVQIDWGLGSAQPQHVTADWPQMGGSLTVVGSYVQVYGRWIRPPSAPPVAVASPVVTGWVGSVDGQLQEDAGELSLTQLVRVLGHAAGPPITEGGAAYVPDYARRVKVVMTSTSLSATQPLPVGALVVPLSGDFPAVMTWQDDAGNQIDGWVQGNLGGGLYVPPPWVPVPARATMLLISTTSPQPAGFSGFAFMHWRIAP